MLRPSGSHICEKVFAGKRKAMLKKIMKTRPLILAEKHATCAGFVKLSFMLIYLMLLIVVEYWDFMLAVK